MDSVANDARISVAPKERIEDLDVIRGFAVLGIFLMNIEYFNRAISGIGEGMPLGLTGPDWFASWFITYFVQGKFWTIFSLLFGMGFAVMLTRAEEAERPFMAPYLRRILGLAVFGAAHYIFLWSGDILFSYAVGAIGLLVLLYGKWKPIVLAVALLVGVGFVPDMDPVFRMAGGLGFVGLASLYLRAERKVRLFGRSLPLFSVVLLALGSLGLLIALVLWLLPNGPKDPRVPVTVGSIIVLILSALSARFHDPEPLRALRLGAGIYVSLCLGFTIVATVQYFQPREPESQPALAVPSDSMGEAALGSPGAVRADAEAQKAAEKKLERAKRLARRQEETRQEVQVMSAGSYLDTVLLHARKFPEKVANDGGFSMLLVAMFLLGSWFVRSGVMANTGANLPLFRKLACIGLPVGIGLGLLGSLIAVSHVPGEEHDGFGIARGLAMLGNLPACLGYVGLVVLMLHSNTFWARIRVLAPVGRMALTNYLAQSLICALYFFGYGLGHWGMARASQVVFVVVVFSFQVAFSHWWLARYRYGPMEWLWRAFTYRQTPAMRR